MFVDVPAGGQGGVSPQEVLPLRCQAWAYCDPSTTPSRGRKADLLLPAADTGPLAKPLLDSFSFISFLDTTDVGVADETVVEAAVHTLVSWSEAGCDVIEEPDVLQVQDIEQLLSMARATEPEMTVEAEMLLHNYYTACRMARSSGLSGSDVPTSAIHALTSLAVGFAKLKLSSVVREEDAVMAIYLYEECLTARFGLSVLQVQPQPHIPESQLPQFLGKELDLLLQHLHIQLLRFCSQVVQSRCVKTEE
ncbi:uncharacterized protein LOC101851527 [Aplysia californica]|uniref:Uncharacterized protein LOC101851527 n=1 Tax=Aplysia californica TaxID=6500 RepID=A0ABM0K2D4_APLCA|nr:uncharacterized protein LOC101851527 [Aplysia californica]